jgi:hypothetical protein
MTTKVKSCLLANSRANMQEFYEALPKSGGGANATLQLIIDKINEIINPTPSVRHLNDVFDLPKMATRTDYFTNIINNLSKSPIMCAMPNGIEYLIALDNDRIHYLSYTGYSETNITTSLPGFSLVSAVYYNDQYFIRRVIIDSDSPVDYTTANLNKLNKKYAKLLKLASVDYSQLTQSNHKKIIAKYHKKLPKDYMLEFTYDNTTYKWGESVPIITFLCRKIPDEYNKIEQKDNQTEQKDKINQKYALFLTISLSDFHNVGVSRLPYHKQLFGESPGFFQPIHFSPATNPMAYIYNSEFALDNEYVQLSWDVSKNGWVFVSKLDKKTSRRQTYQYGDNHRFVETNLWVDTIIRLSYKDLVIDKKALGDQMYFANTKSDMHKSPIKMNNFVKRSLIVPNTQLTVDLASGRASDVMNYRNAHTKQLLFCEIDKDAVIVASERQYQMANPHKTTLNIFNADLNEPAQPNLDQIHTTYGVSPNSVKQVNCFFALHYLTDTQPRIDNITKLIAGLLDNGGKFLYTAFDFDAVNKLLSENNGKWEVRENNKKKYSIIRHYTDKDIATPKRAIKLILPFNVDTYYYDENLINVKLLDTSFAKHGIKPADEGNFMSFAQKFKQSKPQFYNKLTEADKTFIGLYLYKVYSK